MLHHVEENDAFSLAKHVYRKSALYDVTNGVNTTHNSVSRKLLDSFLYGEFRTKT